MTRKSVREAERHLGERDKVMAELVAKIGPCALPLRKTPPFHILTASIVSQQLSTKAAETIERRLAAIVPAPFEAAGFAGVAVEKMRGVGLSSAKGRYILELAARVRDGRLDLTALAAVPDEAAITALIELPGVGRWTAEMFLMFGLHRPDVLSLGDGGLQRAAKLLYGGRAKLANVGKRWRPYRSVASWYLWRHLEAR